jgi:hypothetical protein
LPWEFLSELRGYLLRIASTFYTSVRLRKSAQAREAAKTEAVRHRQVDGKS